jgi:hypothetical protein
LLNALNCRTWCVSRLCGDGIGGVSGLDGLHRTQWVPFDRLVAFRWSAVAGGGCMVVTACGI